MRGLVITLLVILFSLPVLKAGGIEFFKGTWEEAVAEAKKQDKLLFVDAYAVWCGPCKRMAAEVFTDPAVGEFYNKNFVNVKMDMEHGEGPTFGRKYPVSAYPTLLYIDHSGKLVQSVRGARPVADFIEVGRTALAKIDRSGEFAEAYEKGDRSPELVYNYLKALNKAGKPTLKIVNDYLRSQKDLNTETNLRIILEGATEVDSKVYELLIQYREPIARLSSEEEVRNKIFVASENTMKKGINFQSRELVDQAVAQVKKFHPEKAEAFALKADLNFAVAANDSKTYARAARDYAKKVIKSNAGALHELAQETISRFKTDPTALKVAEELAGEAARLENIYGYYLTYASALAMNGKVAEARKAALKALELAKPEGEQAVQNVEQFMQQLPGNSGIK